MNTEIRTKLSEKEIPEISISPNRQPDLVIAFLRRHNYGFPEESAKEGIKIIKDHIQSRLFLGKDPKETRSKEDYSLFDSLIHVLENAGYAAANEIPNNIWSGQAERALNLALKDWNKKNKRWKDKKSSTHESWKL